MTELVRAFASAAEPREIVLRLARRTRERAPADVELWLGIGGWVRGELTGLDARGEAVVLIEPEGQTLYVRVDDVRACRVHAPETVLDILSDGRYEPVDSAALTAPRTQSALQSLESILRDSFGIGLDTDLEAATTETARHSLLAATRDLVTVLEGLGEDPEGAGDLARRLDSVSIEAGNRPNVRCARRRLTYVIAPDEGRQGRLHPDRLKRNVESVLG